MSTSKLTPEDKSKPSCTAARNALCTSISAFPLTWGQRRRHRDKLIKLTEQHQDCDVAKSIERLLYICCFYVNQCRARTSTWSRLHYVFGLPSAILGAIAGATALNSALNSMALGWVTAIFALASAALSAAGAFLRCEERRERNLALLGGWIELGDRVQETLMEYVLAQHGGALAPLNERAFLETLIELNKAKCLLLSGKLRAGPENDQGIIGTKKQNGAYPLETLRNGHATPEIAESPN